MPHLVREDFSTPTWKRFTREVEERLQELREQNDSQSLDPFETAAKRGSIAELKRILGLAHDVNPGESSTPPQWSSEFEED